MTPKEQAELLIGKYYNQRINFTYLHHEDGSCIGDGRMIYLSAKQCALIAVDEILKALHETLDAEYWQAVKTEIEKL